ncbi:hypothetical protein SDC9_173229 [bioreactor metagenome]|uniref:Uncharacterized protein n=1 Tax=bioreactor metagenome TaxID=1076179 RepID=A0A645GQ69_9ZZZZ
MDAALVARLCGGAELGLRVMLKPVVEPIPEGHLGPHLYRCCPTVGFLESLELFQALLFRFGEDILGFGVTVVIIVDDDSPLPASVLAQSYSSVAIFSLSGCHGFNSFPKRSSIKLPTMPDACLCISGVTWV